MSNEDIRIVTHLDVSRAAILETANEFEQIMTRIAA